VPVRRSCGSIGRDRKQPTARRWWTRQVWASAITSKAFAWRERAYQEQSKMLQLLKVHRYFDPLRDKRRFADLSRRVGLS